MEPGGGGWEVGEVGRDSFPGDQCTYLVPRTGFKKRVKERKFASSGTSK